MATACGEETGSSGEASGEVVEVEVLDNVFDPESVEIEVGTTVRWTNDGRNDHNIVPVDSDAGFGVEVEDFGQGDTYEFTFDESEGRFVEAVRGFFTPYVGRAADTWAFRAGVDETVDWLLRQILLLLTVDSDHVRGDQAVRHQVRTFLVPSILIDG